MEQSRAIDELVAGQTMASVCRGGKESLPDANELTPTMKLRRGGILTRFASEIDDFYKAAK